MLRRSVPPNAIACPPALYELSPRADRVTPKTHCLRIEGDDGARQRGAGGDREAAARCNVFTKPYLRNAAVRTRGPYGVDEWLARADETIE